MQPLNPFLAAFFRSSVHAQCTPVHHHILLVPLTDVLLTCRDIESNSPSSEVIASEEFLAGHVLRIPPPGSGPAGKDGQPSLRDLRGKLKQVTTVNGQRLVIKDSVIWGEKGAKGVRNAQILSDSTFYPDVFEPRQWLIYYISKPLVGTWEEIKIVPAILVEGTRRRTLLGAPLPQASGGDGAAKHSKPEKEDIRNFHEVLNHFPAIARQMQPGLEKLFIEFATVFQKPLPPPPSAISIPDPLPDGPIIAAMKKARSNSGSGKSGEPGSQRIPVTENFYAEDDEDIMRASLESAVTAAIDLFQNVDKAQLSLLGIRTDLTGPMVERLIERYVTENINHLLWPRLSALKRPEDLELEAKIRQMEYIDISQLGIFIDGGRQGKHDLIVQLGAAIGEFQKISSAMSPQEMMDLLLSTIKIVSHLTELRGEVSDNPEKHMMTVNADTLVSMLLYVVIRAGVRNLQARLIYIRNFIFIDDVESGELGYALSTFEAVLTYLVMDSSGLRRASRRNKMLWESIKVGMLDEVKNIIEPSSAAVDDDLHSPEAPQSRRNSGTRSMRSTSSRRSSWTYTIPEHFSSGSGLSHVFPFQANGTIEDLPVRKIKRVVMDTRSMSSGSEISFHSRTASLRSTSSALEGDISPERLAKINDEFGESLLMMAIQYGQFEVVKYLLTLPEQYPIEFVLADMNNENTTLLSAAVRLGNVEVINLILDFVASKLTQIELTSFVKIQDIWGRSVGHYLFNAPHLISRIGRVIPWRQRDKNGQTPLFALCRSYDHTDYHNMVESGLKSAREAQQDGSRLHVDEHVDGKGNTLLHIINDPTLAVRISRHCDVDVNATNEKRFTALMVASKYGRYDMVRALFSDPRTDIAARELRGLTAVELAKDEDMRNRIDDLVLFSMPSGKDDRITGVVRAFFVEDGSVRLVLKSAVPTSKDHESWTVTTSRRSLAEFEHLTRLLAEENQASWVPSLADTRSPFQIPTKPSRSLLRDIQAKTDSVLKVLLDHPTFATHEMLWEFFLVPELQLDQMEQRTKLKVETRMERIVEDYEPVQDMREVEQFVNHAREMVRSVGYSTKSVTRRANSVGLAANDMYDSAVLLHRAVSALPFLPPSHVDAFTDYVRAIMPTQANPQVMLHTSMLGIQTTTQALLSALSRPATLISQIGAAKRDADRNASAAARPSRWPLGIMDDARQRTQEEKEGKARKSRREADLLARELRYTQQTVAGELAGWQNMHDLMGRRAIRQYVKDVLVQERTKMEGMMRALRKVKGGWGDKVGKTDLKVMDREMADAAAEVGDEANGGEDV